MRADGKRVKNSVDHMYTIAPYFMVDRNDACNSLTVRLPYQPIHDYMIKKRKEGEKFSTLSIVTAAMVRAIAEHPFLNRFVVNRKIYAHNEILFAMVVMRGEGDQSSMGKMKFEPEDTIFDVNRKINEFVAANRHENGNDTDKILGFLTKMPPLIRMITGILKWGDKHGLLPKAVLDMSPFHASVVVTNLASIRTNHIYHHVYNFGTVGSIYALGNMEDVPKMVNGEIVLERQIPIGVVCDERLGDGHAYARAFATFAKYAKNPELLEQPPEKVIKDI